MSKRAVMQAAVLLSLWASGLHAGPGLQALIVWDGTADSNEVAVKNNLNTHLTTASYTVTLSIGVPGTSLAVYKQIWDVRYQDVTALSGPDITAYLTYLSGGGSLFVMGENANGSFTVRNNSIVALVQAAGGGTITVVPGADTQTVQPAFSAGVPTITYLADAGVPSPPGRGNYITKDAANIGAGVVFSPGSMTNALTGSLLIVFDVNFLERPSDVPSETLVDNLIAYLASPSVIPSISTTPVPTLSGWAMLLLAVALAVVGCFRVARAPQQA